MAVLLTCHNRYEKTINCLNALYKCIIPNQYFFDVFLVDDGSTDGTAERVKKVFPAVNIIMANGELYWNRGMYLAWNAAKNKMNYNYYFWLNDDTILFENSLKIMLDYSSVVNNNKIIVGATCSSINEEITYSGYIFPGKKLVPNGTWQDCNYFNGNIVLIPNDIFVKVGLIDKRFRHSLGDFDYGMRAFKLGFVHALSPIYLGVCESHEIEPIWRNTSVPVIKRLQYLYTPLGNNPFEFFIFDKRHYGFLTALIHFITIHLRTFFPFIWKTKLIKHKYD